MEGETEHVSPERHLEQSGELGAPGKATDLPDDGLVPGLQLCLLIRTAQFLGQAGDGQRGGGAPTQTKES